MTKYQTAQIGRKQATNIFHAIRYANDNQRPLNVMVTINLTDLGLSALEAGDFFREARARVARWWVYQRVKNRPFGSFDDVAAHAHPPQGRRHVHWLLHVPNGIRYEVEAVIENRLKKMLNLDCLGNAIEIKDVGNSGTLGKYILRGTDPLYAEYFHMWTADEGVGGLRRNGTENLHKDLRGLAVIRSYRRHQGGILSAWPGFVEFPQGGQSCCRLGIPDPRQDQTSPAPCCAHLH